MIAFQIVLKATASFRVQSTHEISMISHIAVNTTISLHQLTLRKPSTQWIMRGSLRSWDIWTFPNVFSVPLKIYTKHQNLEYLSTIIPQSSSLSVRELDSLYFLLNSKKPLTARINQSSEIDNLYLHPSKKIKCVAYANDTIFTLRDIYSAEFNFLFLSKTFFPNLWTTVLDKKEIKRFKV